MVNPLLGVGPYQWRMLDLQDGGKYFNTWHIHNILIHTGVELGLIAMAMLIAIFICFCLKRKSPAAKATFFAFVLHNMMDTSFFYLGITAFLLLSVSEPQKGGKIIHTSVLRILYGVFAIFFVYNLYFFLHMGQSGV